MALGVRTLPATKRDEVLQAACDRCEPMEVLVGRDGRIMKHASRFLRASIRDGGPHLIIELPTRDGKLVEYHRDEEVEALFHVGGERYAFSTLVEGRCMHELNGQQKVAALVLAYPREMENRQRRAHYRIPVSMAIPVSVAFIEVTTPGESFEMLGIHSGFISDISAGGLAVVCRQRLPVSIEVGTSLSISFQLPGEPEHLALKGLIRNVRKADTNEARILGIEYLREDYDIRSRRHIDLIQRFVVKRQREILKKLRIL